MGTEQEEDGRNKYVNGEKRIQVEVSIEKGFRSAKSAADWGGMPIRSSTRWANSRRLPSRCKRLFTLMGTTAF